MKSKREVQTRRWLETFVIGLGLCPFARVPFVSGRIRYVESHAKNEEELVLEIERECRWLAETSVERVETTLLMLSDAWDDFAFYYDGIGLAESWMEQAGWEGVFQLASFHPSYLFEGERLDEVTHFTNRSPIPLVHILREESVDRAVDSGLDVDHIPTKNIDTMKSLGLARVMEMWKSCKK